MGITYANDWLRGLLQLNTKDCNLSPPWEKKSCNLSKCLAEENASTKLQLFLCKNRPSWPTMYWPPTPYPFFTVTSLGPGGVHPTCIGLDIYFSPKGELLIMRWTSLKSSLCYKWKKMSVTLEESLPEFEQELSLHIDVLELWANQTLLSIPSPYQVIIGTDSHSQHHCNVLSEQVRNGGHASRLCQEALSFGETCITENIAPISQNRLAHFLKRSPAVSHKWFLKKSFLKPIFQMWGMPSIVLFAMEDYKRRW